MQNMAVTKGFLEKEIRKHHEEIKTQNEKEITDFCHAYLVEMERIEAAGNPDAYMFNLQQLLGVIGKQVRLTFAKLVKQLLSVIGELRLLKLQTFIYFLSF